MDVLSSLTRFFPFSHFGAEPKPEKMDESSDEAYVASLQGNDQAVSKIIQSNCYDHATFKEPSSQGQISLTLQTFKMPSPQVQSQLAQVADSIKTLSVKNLGGYWVVEEIVDKVICPQFKNLQALSLHGCSITDTMEKQLVQLQNLHTVTVLGDASDFRKEKVQLLKPLKDYLNEALKTTDNFYLKALHNLLKHSTDVGILMTEKGFASFCKSLASESLTEQDTKLLCEFCDSRIKEPFEKLNLQEIHVILGAFARLQIHHKGLFEYLAEEIEERKSELKDLDVSQLAITLWAFDSQGFAHTRLFTLFAEELKTRKFENLNEKQITSVICAVARARIVDRSLFGHLADEIKQRNGHGFKPHYVKLIQRAYEESGLKAIEPFRQLESAVSQ
jgi:hypothetical protein